MVCSLTTFPDSRRPETTMAASVEKPSDDQMLSQRKRKKNVSKIVTRHVEPATEPACRRCGSSELSVRTIEAVAEMKQQEANDRCGPSTWKPRVRERGNEKGRDSATRDLAR